MQIRQATNLVVTLLLMALFGFLIPLTFARRITAIGLLVCLAGFALAAGSAAATGHTFGGLYALAAWGVINLLVAIAWIKFALHISAALRHAPAPRAPES